MYALSISDYYMKLLKYWYINAFSFKINKLDEINTNVLYMFMIVGFTLCSKLCWLKPSYQLEQFYWLPLRLAFLTYITYRKHIR